MPRATQKLIDKDGGRCSSLLTYKDEAVLPRYLEALVDDRRVFVKLTDEERQKILTECKGDLHTFYSKYIRDRIGDQPFSYDIEFTQHPMPEVYLEAIPEDITGPRFDYIEATKDYPYNYIAYLADLTEPWPMHDGAYGFIRLKPRQKYRLMQSESYADELVHKQLAALELSQDGYVWKLFRMRPDEVRSWYPHKNTDYYEREWTDVTDEEIEGTETHALIYADWTTYKVKLSEKLRRARWAWNEGYKSDDNDRLWDMCSINGFDIKKVLRVGLSIRYVHDNLKEEFIGFTDEELADFKKKVWGEDH